MPVNILKPQQLVRLTEHKYSSSGTTLLDPFMQKFWQWTVAKFPTWVAPNMMTVVGLIINALTTFILIYHSPDARQVVPAWSLILFAVGLFIYQTLDACDGKQARRTQSSSPLGELFDHGCDSLSTVFVALSACIAVQLGQYPNLMFYQCIAASTLFYAAHWQTYVSAKLRFGRFDVTEAQFCIITLHLVSAFCGPQIWSKTVPYVNMELRLLVLYVIFGGALNQFYYYFKIIFAGGVGKNGSTVAGTSVLSPFIPIAVVILPAFIIYQKSTTNLVQDHPSLYLLTFGLIIAKITNKLVIAHMTRSEMEYLDSVLIAPCLLFLNQYFNTFFSEYLVLWVALVYAIVDIFYYASNVCLQISAYLNIYIFSIKPRPVVNNKLDNHKQSKSNLNDREFATTDTRSRQAIERRSLMESVDYNSEEDDSGEKNSTLAGKTANTSSTLMSTVGSDEEETNEIIVNVVLNNHDDDHDREDQEKKEENQSLPDGQDQTVIIMNDAEEDKKEIDEQVDCTNNVPKFASTDDDLTNKPEVVISTIDTSSKVDDKE